MKLHLALGISSGDVTAFVGAGGKSSAILMIAEELMEAGKTVLAVPTIVNGSPKLTWTPPAVTGSQRPIRFYRIYRDGGTTPTLADRYDVTVIASKTWSDSSPGNTTSHRYWVTAVDTSNNESSPSNGVQSP